MLNRCCRWLWTTVEDFAADLNVCLLNDFSFSKESLVIFTEELTDLAPMFEQNVKYMQPRFLVWQC